MGLKPRATPTRATAPAPAAIRHGSSDSWLLVAIDQSQGTLVSIISTADYINRAILTFEELSGGLSRLTAAGLIDQTPLGYETSARGRAFFAALDPMIRDTTAAAGVALGSNADPTPGFEIGRAEYDRAIADYQSRF